MYEMTNLFSFGGNLRPAPSDIGTPENDAMFAQGAQEADDTCAIRAQKYVLNMFGIDVSEPWLVVNAAIHGEYGNGEHAGTLIPDVGNLLERHGIDVQQYENATVANLIAELAQGHKIIAAVDAYELWTDTLSGQFAQKLKDVVMQTPNHAIVVAGLDAKTMEVSVIDPAFGELHKVPVSKFMDAWKDSNCFMVATTQSPDDLKDSLPHAARADEPSIASGGTALPSAALGEASAPCGESDAFSVGQADIHMDPVLLNLHGEQISAVAIDLNDDHIADFIGMDTTHDGVIDTFAIPLDNDGDGVVDGYGLDTDCDGEIDRYISVDDFESGRW